MFSWLTYLKSNHDELHQQYLEEMERIDQSKSGTRCVESLACMQRWAAKAKELATTKEPERATV